MKATFTDACGRPIYDLAQVYFKGDFPTEMPVFDEKMYNAIGDKHSRRGMVIIRDKMLVFITNVNGRVQSTGLSWELDGEPCYDLILIEEV
jgi:hypothetical protein